MLGIASSIGKELDAAAFDTPQTKDPYHQPMDLTAISIDETENEYLLSVGAPGMRREDFYVWIDQNTITVIAGAKEGAPFFKDLTGSTLADYVRSCTLPDNADPLLTCANFINGKLEIHIPKGENTEEKPIMIHVY